MANNPIPVYVFTGFLESGKTKFIKEILADPNFTENEVTALLLCEEGIEEYDEKWLAHYGTALVPVESEDRLTPNILKRIEQKYNPDRIIVEYNGMWKLESLMQAFPRAGSCTRSSRRSTRPPSRSTRTTSARRCSSTSPPPTWSFSTAARTRSRRCSTRRTSRR